MARRKGFTFERDIGRYRGPHGRFVARDAVRQALDAALDNAGLRAKALAEALRQQTITRADWYVGMRSLVKETQLYSTALARGGWAQMSGTRFAEVATEVGRQYDYLNGFLRDVQGGLPLDGRFVNRSGMYAQSARTTFHEAFREEQAERGMTEEQSIRHSSDSCPGCIAEAQRGWAPIGSLIPIGERTCLTQCLCSVEYR